MSAAKAQPTTAPTDPIALAAADLRAATAEVRDKAVELGQELVAVHLERRAYAEVVAERDRLIGEIHQHQQALMVALVRLSRTGGPQHAATSEETPDVH